MSKTGIFYGSTTGNTEAAAGQMAELIDADVYDVAESPADKLEQYENLILGASTWGIGDLQDDWEDFIKELEKADLNGKTVAIFGFGDAAGYEDSFVDGIGIIYNAIKEKGCKVVGFMSTNGYEYDSSVAESDGQFVGLPLDEENQGDLTDQRVKNWIEQIKPEFS